MWNAGDTCDLPLAHMLENGSVGTSTDPHSRPQSSTRLYLLSFDELDKVKMNLKGGLENSKTGRDRCLSNHNIRIKSSPCTRYCQRKKPLLPQT